MGVFREVICTSLDPYMAPAHTLPCIVTMHMLYVLPHHNDGIVIDYDVKG